MMLRQLNNSIINNKSNKYPAVTMIRIPMDIIALASLPSYLLMALREWIQLIGMLSIIFKLPFRQSSKCVYLLDFYTSIILYYGDCVH